MDHHRKSIADANALTKEGLTSLRLAAFTGCIVSAKILIKKGANVSAVEGISEDSKKVYIIV